MHYALLILYNFNENGKCYVKIITHFYFIFLDKKQNIKKNILERSGNTYNNFWNHRKHNKPRNQEKVYNFVRVFAVIFQILIFLCSLVPICFFILFIWIILKIINALSPFYFNFNANWKYYVKIIYLF